MIAFLLKQRRGDGEAYASHRSEPEKIRNGHQRNADCNDQNRVGDEVGKDNESQSTYQRHNRPLLSAVDEKPEPDRAEQQSPKKRRSFQIPRHRARSDRLLVVISALSQSV
jgi:hypothetical protein